MVQQVVARRDGREQFFGPLQAAVERRRHARPEDRVFQVGTVDPVAQLHQPGQVDRTVDAIGVGRPEAEFALQEQFQVGRHGVRDLQAHRGAEIALREFALESLAQVGDFFLVHEQVAVARHPPLVAALDVHPREQVADEGVDQGGEQHEAVRDAGDLGGHLDHARQRARRLDDRDVPLAAEGVLAAERDDEVQALVVDARKGVRRIQADGGQQGHHVAAEDPVGPFPLQVGPARRIDQAHPVFHQLGHDLARQQAVLAVHQGVRGPLHPVEGLVGRHAVHAPQLRRLALLFLEAGHADLEELVQVRADDAQVAQALQHRHVRALGHGEHPLVEFQHRQFTVQENRHFLDGPHARLTILS
ncbi:hypothetical protein CDEN61S_00939 [Castellaniella denitrificans]